MIRLKLFVFIFIYPDSSWIIQIPRYTNTENITLFTKRFETSKQWNSETIYNIRCKFTTPHPAWWIMHPLWKNHDIQEWYHYSASWELVLPTLTTEGKPTVVTALRHACDEFPALFLEQSWHLRAISSLFGDVVAFKAYALKTQGAKVRSTTFSKVFFWCKKNSLLLLDISGW